MHHEHDLQIYNETITVFWVRRVQSFLLVEAFNNPRIIFDYYSKEHLMSDAARRSWQEPDLQPLDF